MFRPQLITAGTQTLTLGKVFLRWWGNELRELLPPGLRAGARAARAELIIRCEGDELSWEARRGDRSSLPRPLPGVTAGPAARRAFMTELSDSIDEPDDAVLILPESHVLRSQVRLPRAAAENLRAVLGFEMDRHTPFRADQVYYDFRLRPSSTTEQDLSVELLVVPRRTLDPVVERIAALGIGLARIAAGSRQDAVDAGGELNLLPPERRASGAASRGVANRVLGAVAAGLAVAAAVVPLAKLHVAESALAAEVESARALAEEVAGLREELSAGIAETEAVMQRKQTEPAVVELLAELAGIVPDHTWLRSLELRGGTLQIQGESGAASELIGLIEGSRLFEAVSFVSPVTRNPGSNLESFELSTKVAGRQ